MTTTELDPTIREVAKVFRFQIYEDSVTGRWVIQDSDTSFDNQNFFWDSTQDKQDFFDELKKYFFELGYNKAIKQIVGECVLL